MSVLFNFPHPVRLALGGDKVVNFAKGPQFVSDELAEHWYIKPYKVKDGEVDEPEVKDEPNLKGDPTLLGADGFPSLIEVRGKNIPLGDAIAVAFKAAGITHDEWNDLEDADRSAAISSAIETMRTTKKKR